MNYSRMEPEATDPRLPSFVRDMRSEAARKSREPGGSVPVSGTFCNVADQPRCDVWDRPPGGDFAQPRPARVGCGAAGRQEISGGADRPRGWTTGRNSGNMVRQIELLLPRLRGR